MNGSVGVNIAGSVMDGSEAPTRALTRICSRVRVLGPKPGFELPVWEENFSRQELRQMLVECYKGFYLRPGYILRNLCRVRTPGPYPPESSLRSIRPPSSRPAVIIPIKALQPAPAREERGS